MSDLENKCRFMFSIVYLPLGHRVVLSVQPTKKKTLFIYSNTINFPIFKIKLSFLEISASIYRKIGLF